jgi:hypothetical protein
MVQQMHTVHKGINLPQCSIIAWLSTAQKQGLCSPCMVRVNEAEVSFNCQVSNQVSYSRCLMNSEPMLCSA